MEELAKLINNLIDQEGRTRRDDPKFKELSKNIDELTRIYINHFKDEL